MDDFNQRISLDEVSKIVQTAQRSKLLDAPSAIFHHLGLMRARLAELQAAFPDRTLHTVAIKANPVLEILREVVRTGAGLEAASIEEVQLALAAECPAERIVFDSPAKTREEIQEALRWCVYLNADSFDELDRIAAARKNYESTSIIGLRVNVMVGAGTIRHTSVSESTSKFGVPLVAGRQRIIAEFPKHDWLRGLHIHVGSQGCDLSLLVEAAGRIAALRQAILAETGRNVAHVDLGGGLPTIYRTGDRAPTPAEYRMLLEKHNPDLFASDVRLVTEFGRAIQANCGFAVSRVEYVKPAQRLAVIHLGADFLLRPVYRPEDWMHEFFVLDRHGLPKRGVPTAVTIAGPLCFGGDIVAREILMPPVDEGDWIVIRDVGAYTLSMWSRHCSRGIPSVIGYDPRQTARQTETLRIMRRGEAPGDVVRFWS